MIKVGNRTLGDDIEDHYYGTQGINTGSYSNSVGLREYERNRQAQTQTTIGGSHSAPRTSTPPEESLASLLSLAACAAIAYYGIVELAYRWYLRLPDPGRATALFDVDIEMGDSGNDAGRTNLCRRVHIQHEHLSPVAHHAQAAAGIVSPIARNQ